MESKMIYSTTQETRVMNDALFASSKIEKISKSSVILVYCLSETNMNPNSTSDSLIYVKIKFASDKLVQIYTDDAYCIYCQIIDY